MTLYEMAKATWQYLDREIRKTEEALSDAPKGTLMAHKNRHSYKWYVRSDEKDSRRIYIPKREEDYARALALKMYRQHYLRDLQKEKRAVEAYLKMHVDGPSETQVMRNREAGLSDLLPTFRTKEEWLEKWSRSSYEKNASHPEALRVKAGKGLFVRSKSEALIVSALNAKGIPFRYECLFQHRGLHVYPDFMILHPVSQELYLWEHLGMLDDAAYYAAAVRKMRAYIECGYVPTDHLIVTCETSLVPLDINYVNALIEHYFLGTTPFRSEDAAGGVYGDFRG